MLSGPLDFARKASSPKLLCKSTFRRRGWGWGGTGGDGGLFSASELGSRF